MRRSFWLLVCAVIIAICESATLPPATVTSDVDQAFVITTIETPTEELEDDMGGTVSSEAEVEPSAPLSKDASTVGAAQSPEIYSFHIDSHIRYRYSRTYVTSRVANRDAQKSQEAVFKVVLPETAFISKFIMDIDGKSYEAYVKEKEVAKNIYNQAQSQGQSAGLVEVNTRNANVFNVNVNVKAGSKVNFNLTYEELLSRRLGRYEQSINIIPDQIMNVNDFQVTVNIEESQNITTLRVPQIRNDIEAETDSVGNNPDAVIERPTGNKANITWKPSKKDQAALTKQGSTGKFIVQYDIKRELDAGEVLIMNGYFVHFFAPDNLPPLRKHVVFILDVSGSMWGTRIEQLKESMNKILADMSTDDFFNIITFSSDVNLWGLDDKVTTSPDNYWSHVAHMEDTARLKAEEEAKKYPIAATKENIDKAQKYINSLVAQGGTNIHDSIIKALNLTTHIKNARKASLEGVTTVSSTSTPESTSTTTVSEPSETSTGSSNLTATTTVPTAMALKSKQLPVLPAGVESLILFLTDGEPTVGETNPTIIQTLIRQANANESVPIFSLAFGEGADFPFVRKLSLQNNGFARKIYEAADTTLQLKGFYNEIASPLLSNVKFNYTSPIGEISNLTITKYPTVFGGTEIAICGTFTPKPNGNDTVNPNDVESINATTPSSSSTEKIARLEDSMALPQDSAFTHGEPCSYNQDFGFDVSVTGNGRDGNSMELRRPCIWSNPIPWGLPVLRPFPPRPTPPPTLEDTFLEKMWAYLTIKQLIDKDLATIGDAPTIDMDNDILSAEKTTDAPVAVETTTLPVSNLTISNTTALGNKTVETPKQKALRIALKYSFVTPLTSLVVVKPNSTDIENTRPADGSSQTAVDSQAASSGVSMNTLQFSKRRISAGFGGASPNALSAYGLRSGPPSYGGAMALAHSFSGGSPFYSSIRGIGASGGHAPMPIYSASFDLEAADYSDDTQDEENFMSESLSVQTTTYTPPLRLPTTTIKSTNAVPTLTLNDITWFAENTNNTQDGKITVNGTSYLLAKEDATLEPSLSQECVVRERNETGVCVHVKDCVQSAFLSDFKVYEESYFCQIPSGSENYAGTCCPDQKRKIVVP